MRKFLKRTGITALVLAILSGILWGFLRKQNPRETVTSYTGTKVDIENMTFYNRNDKIAGTIYRPVGDSVSRMPVLIYCPSIGMNRDAGASICKGAAGKGYIGYAFDFRGGSPNSASAGLSTTDMTLSSEISDLKAVIKGIRGLRHADKKNIFLVGEGFGGVVAAAIAAEKPSVCNGIILISPDLNYSDLLRERYPRKRDIPDTLLVDNTLLGKEFIRDLRDRDTKSLLHDYPKEYLFLESSSGHDPIFRINAFISEHLED